MVTIKYVWFYAVVFVASLSGFGAAYVTQPEDLSKELKLANEQIERIALNCAREKEAFKQAPVVQSPSRGF